MKAYSIILGLLSIIYLLLLQSCKYKQQYYQRKHIPMRELKKSIPAYSRDTFLVVPEPKVKKPTIYFY